MSTRTAIMDDRPQQNADEELLSRVRRIETRVTALSAAMGVHTGSKPALEPAEQRIILPSFHSTMKEVLDSIPETWDGPLGVFVGDRLVATIDKAGNRF